MLLRARERSGRCRQGRGTGTDRRSRWTSGPAGASLAAIAFGAALGLVAQTLRAQDARAVSDLGGATAIWVVLGFLLVLRIRHRWSAADRLAWTMASAALSLAAWVTAYHGLFLWRTGVPWGPVWNDARPWVALLAPAGVAIGAVAAVGDRDSLLGDAALASPLALAAPEVWAAVHRGWTETVIVGIPSLAVALVPLAAAGRRRGRRQRAAPASEAPTA